MAKRQNKQTFSSCRPCDIEGCPNLGTHRAPKSRDNLKEYYWFCLDHVKAYNASWNYYDGMSGWEIEQSRRSDFVWERPSWPLGKMPTLRDMILLHLYSQGQFHVVGDGDAQPGNHHAIPHPPQFHQHEHIEALKVLQLTQPITSDSLQQQYRLLAKEYHPDRRQGCRKSEEKLKQINAAYSLLKRALESSM